MDIIASMMQSISNASQSLDEAGRKLLIDQLCALARQLESPYDTMQRILYTNMQLSMVKTGVDLNLFQMLVDSNDGLTTQQISSETKAHPALVSRLCRYYASTGMIDEVAAEHWKANAITRTLIVPGWAGAICQYHDLNGVIWQQTPAWLREHGYPDINDSTNAPFQAAFKTDLPVLRWITGQPELLDNFRKFMTVQRGSQPPCFSVYDLKKQAEGLAVDQPFFVDIGGNAGHQAIVVREMLPDLPNDIINEDLEVPLSIAFDHAGVKKVVQDFFLPQVVKGARIYYLRNILHDWPDDKCVEILRNTKAALSDGIILIDEMVLPETKAPWQAAQLDLTMMVGLAARERTIGQWESIVADAGLRIQKIYTYTTSLRDSIIECVPS